MTALTKDVREYQKLVRRREVLLATACSAHRCGLRDCLSFPATLETYVTSD